TIYKAIFGMENTMEGIGLRPFVPEALAGNHRLENYAYRGAVLDITLEGHGHRIASMTLNGEPMASAFVPADATGRQQIHVVLEPEGREDSGFNLVNNVFSPETPVLRVSGN